jgi:hypothetical protein
VRVEVYFVTDSSYPAKCRAGDRYQQAERADLDHYRIDTAAFECAVYSYYHFINWLRISRAGLKHRPYIFL